MLRRRLLSILAAAGATVVAVVAVATFGTSVAPLGSNASASTLVDHARVTTRIVDAAIPSAARDLTHSEIRVLRAKHLDQGIKLGLAVLAALIAAIALRDRRVLALLASARIQSGDWNQLGRGPPATLLT